MVKCECCGLEAETHIIMNCPKCGNEIFRVEMFDRHLMLKCTVCGEKICLTLEAPFTDILLYAFKEEE